MKSQKGITMASLGVYIVVSIIVVATLATIMANYKNSIKTMDNDAEYLSEYNKFNLYFLEEVKKPENSSMERANSIRTKENEYNSIKFKTGNEFMYKIKEEILYLNKSTEEKIKLIKNVKKCTFEFNDIDHEANGKNVIRVNIQIGETTPKEYTYVLDGENSTNSYSTENGYIEGIITIPKAWNSSKLNEKDPFRTEEINGNYSIAPIPNGYQVSTIEGENKISTGLIITDGTNRFKWCQGNELLVYDEANYGTTWTAAMDVTDLTSTKAIYESLKESKTLYGGAYIKEDETTDTVKSILWIK